MLMRIIIEADYLITDDLAARERDYGTTEPRECAQIDLDELRNEIAPDGVLEFCPEATIRTLTIYRVKEA